MRTVSLDRALKIPGWMKTAELHWLANVASDARVIIEVGTWKGRSTRALGDHCKGVVYAVDGYIDPLEATDQTNQELKTRGPKAIAAEAYANLHDLIKAGRVVLVRGRSTEAAGKIAVRLGHRPLADLVFIDADHTYEGCKADILAYQPLVAPKRGILAGHDYGEKAHPGVKRAVDELFGDRVRRGPGSIWMVTA